MKLRAGFFVLLIFTPLAALAAGIVPACAGAACNLCDLLQLFENVINYALGIAIPIAAVCFAWSGILYFSSGANPSHIERAKSIFKSVFIGFIVAVAAWLIVQTIISTLVTGKVFAGSSWNDLQCTQRATGTSGNPVDNVLGGNPTTPPEVVVTTPSGAAQGSTEETVAASQICFDNGLAFDYASQRCVDETGSPVGPNSSALQIAARMQVCEKSGLSYSQVYQRCVNPSTGKVTGPSFLTGAAGGSGVAGVYICGGGDVYDHQIDACVNPAFPGEADFSQSPLFVPAAPTTGPTGGSPSTLTGQASFNQLQALCLSRGDVNCNLAAAIMKAESGGQCSQVGPTEDWGCMQVTCSAAQTFSQGVFNSSTPCSDIKQKMLSDSGLNMTIGMNELAYCKRIVPSGDIKTIAACYNGGPGAIAKSKSCLNELVYQCTLNTGYAVTRNYVITVQAFYNQFSGSNSPTV